MIPDEQGVFFVLVVQGGPGSGEFIYDANGNLRSSNVGQATTDPIKGLSCPQGFATWNGHGSIVNLLSTADGKGAFFQYQDNQSNVQGTLILAVSSVAGTDPVGGAAYPAGLYGVDPAFGDTLTATGANIHLSQVAYTLAGTILAAAGGGATSPSLRLDAPEQGTGFHLEMLMQGDSPDGSHFGQLLIGRVATAGALTPVSTALVEIQGNASNTPALLLQAAASGNALLAGLVAGDAFNRGLINSDFQISWGSGGAARDCFLSRQAANIIQVTSADFDIATLGKGLRVKEGANAKLGVATLNAGTVVVNNTSVTANSRIQLTAQDNNSTGALRVSARTAGTSFTITSSNAADSGVVAWEIIEPG